MDRVKLLTLKNGIDVYYGEQYRCNTGGVGVRVGGMHAPPGKHGLPHFVEHKISRRSKRYPDGKKVSLMLRRLLGKDINIRTDRTSTYYGHDDLLRKKYRLQAFDLMASFFHPATRIIDDEGLKVEKAAVHNEYRENGTDSIPGLLDDAIYQTLYTYNPVRNRVDCEKGDLKSTTLEDAERFMRRCYVPKETFILLLGLGKREAKKIAQFYFGDWNVTSRPRFDYDGSDNFPKLTQVKSAPDIELDIHQHHLAIAYPTEPYMSEDREALELLSRILEFRLHERLREENIEFDAGVYHPSVEWESTGVSGMIAIKLATVGNMDYVNRMEEVVREEAKKLREERVSKEEFEERERLRDEYNDAFWNSPSTLAEKVIDATCNGDRKLIKLNDFRNRLNKLNRSKLCDVAHKYFENDNYARVLIRPKDGHHCERC